MIKTWWFTSRITWLYFSEFSSSLNQVFCCWIHSANRDTVLSDREVRTFQDWNLLSVVFFSSSSSSSCHQREKEDTLNNWDGSAGGKMEMWVLSSKINSDCSFFYSLWKLLFSLLLLFVNLIWFIVNGPRYQRAAQARAGH